MQQEGALKIAQEDRIWIPQNCNQFVYTVVKSEKLAIKFYEKDSGNFNKTKTHV